MVYTEGAYLDISVPYSVAKTEIILRRGVRYFCHTKQGDCGSHVSRVDSKT